MIAAMTTRIVSSEGATVTVTAEAEEVRNRLAEDKQRGEPFTQFEEQGGQGLREAGDFQVVVWKGRLKANANTDRG